MGIGYNYNNSDLTRRWLYYTILYYLYICVIYSITCDMISLIMINYFVVTIIYYINTTIDLLVWMYYVEHY